MNDETTWLDLVLQSQAIREEECQPGVRMLLKVGQG